VNMAAVIGLSKAVLCLIVSRSALPANPKVIQMEAWMTIKLFLSIIGALGVLHGAAFIVAPDQVASIYGSP
jgi:hypothetical protein